MLHVVSICWGWKKLLDPVHSDWLNYGGGLSRVIVKQMIL